VVRACCAVLGCFAVPVGSAVLEGTTMERTEDARVSLEQELAAVVGAEHVLTDPSLTVPYDTDWTRRFAGGPARWCGRRRRPRRRRWWRAVRPQASPSSRRAATPGSSGASVPRGAGAQVVVSTRRLRALGSVDAVAGQVTAGAGCR
jgi:FAD/FMN-containing dehydrogenase